MPSERTWTAHMIRISRFAFVLIAAALFAGTQSSTTDAAIVCDGAYQVFKQGGQHRSNICENRHLARVAGHYGMRVSARTIRNRPSIKAEVCQAIGYDIRVDDICRGHRTDGSEGRRKR